MQKNRNSIIKELLRYNISYSVIITLILTIFMTLVIFDLEKHKAEGMLQKTNYAINLFIEGYFKELVDFIDILSNDNDIINAQYMDNEAKKKILKKYRTYQNINQDISYIYSAYTNKKILINNYTLPQNYDPTIRPWYKIVMDRPEKEKEAIGFLYQEIKSREWLISTIKILESKKHGYTGVVAVDSFSRSISEKLDERLKGYSSAYSYTLDKNAKVNIHPDPSVIGRVFLNSVKTKYKDMKEGIFFYTYKNRYKMAYLSRVKTPGWFLITTVDMAEVLKPIIFKIFLCFLFISGFATISGVFQSRLLMKKFISPFIALKKRIKDVLILGEVTDSYRFPENEIGYIAKQIENMTEQALYKKNIELQTANEKINEINLDLEKKNNLLKSLAIHDSLTGIFNRQKLEETFKSEFYRFSRYKTPLSGILLDIDLFKSINDTFGHNAGDLVLKEISLLISKNIRETDIIGRWGGEEFLILLPNTSLPFAAKTAEKIRTLIMNHNFSIDRMVTVSLGVVELQKDEKGTEAFIRMDKKLYEAKEKGRNQVRY